MVNNSVRDPVNFYLHEYTYLFPGKTLGCLMLYCQVPSERREKHRPTESIFLLGPLSSYSSGST